MYMFQRVLINGMKSVLIILMALITFAVSWGVFTRYVLNSSAVWTGELAGYTLVWITFIGSAYAIFQKTHIRFESLIDKLPRPIAMAVQTFFNLFILAFVSVATYYGAMVSLGAMHDSSTTLPFSKGIVYLVIPIGCAIMVIGLIYETVAMYKRRET
jgi:TRAP-type C4-dicarboxylate transport system permease small subunit